MEKKKQKLIAEIEAVEWDGVARCSRFATDFLGARESTYNSELGSKFLLSAIARLYVSGCKVDQCLVLEGGQGAGKSTALRLLAGEVNIDVLKLDSSAEIDQDVWFFEMSEWHSMVNGDQESLKGFLSRQSDKYRGKAKEVPRSCVFVLTSTEPTENTRSFWPIQVGAINFSRIKEERLQIWAEALYRYQAGEKWWDETQTTKRVTGHEHLAEVSELDPDLLPARVGFQAPVMHLEAVRHLINRSVKGFGLRPIPEAKPVAVCEVEPLMGWAVFCGEDEDGGAKCVAWFANEQDAENFVPEEEDALTMVAPASSKGIRWASSPSHIEAHIALAAAFLCDAYTRDKSVFITEVKSLTEEELEDCLFTMKRGWQHVESGFNLEYRKATTIYKEELERRRFEASAKNVVPQ